MTASKLSAPPLSAFSPVTSSNSESNFPKDLNFDYRGSYTYYNNTTLHYIIPTTIDPIVANYNAHLDVKNRPVKGLHSGEVVFIFTLKNYVPDEYSYCTAHKIFHPHALFGPYCNQINSFLPNNPVKLIQDLVSQTPDINRNGYSPTTNSSIIQRPTISNNAGQNSQANKHDVNFLLHSLDAQIHGLEQQQNQIYRTYANTVTTPANRRLNFSLFQNK